MTMTMPAVHEDTRPGVGASLDEAFAWATAGLRRAGVEAPRREARLLLAAALEVDAARLVAGNGVPSLSLSQERRFAAMVARRRAREPLSRILGRREFWSLDFAVTPATLDPRADSETLIETVLGRLGAPGGPRRVLDLGTGSGCLLLALLSELPMAWGLGVDVEPRALAVARANAARLGLADRSTFVAADWGGALAGRWDVILCNPPYVKTAEIDRLGREVARFEPRGALDGGPDGLAAYRRVVPEVARLLAADGLAALEIGAGQGDSVARLAKAAGLITGERGRDLAGRERCLLLTRGPAA